MIKESKKNEDRINTLTQVFLPVDSFLNKDNYVKEPLYKTITTKKNFEKQEARIKAGLTVDPQDIKTKNVEFKYSSSPKNTSFSDMKSTRRSRLIDKLNQSADFSHKTYYEKVENEKQYIGTSGKLLRDTILEQKKQDVTHYEQIFGHIASGIHGKELPTFEKNFQEY